MKIVLIAALALASALTMAGPACAQVPPLATFDTAADSVRRVSPRSAFIRSVFVPGWGQASVGAYTRGGIYFGIQSTSGYMLMRTLGRLSEVRGMERRRVAAATDSLRQLMAQDTLEAARLADPLVFAEAVAADEGVAASRALIESRKRQRQDWITYTIFLTLLSGLDAYVTAHLRDWPGELFVEPRGDGGFELGLSLPAFGPQRP